MVMVRTVMSCKPGKVGAVVGKFKELNAWMEQKGHAPYRILTDAAGEQFWTMVLERDFESMDSAQAFVADTLEDAQAKEIMAGYHDLVTAGRREIYTVEG